jgi:chemosensory pili system protein ChpA (sensor histidine kinase/response regulator)
MLDSNNDRSPADTPLADLGPLAWVFDELRKSLEGANKAIKRFVRESEQSRQNDLEAADPASLRLARQQLHQAVGALEMVGLAAPAQVLRAMEAAVQRFVHRPLTCTDEAAMTVERAGFALVEYLQAVLNNKLVQPLALFPQYRDVQALAGAERVHPADLWSFESHRQDMAAPEVPKSMQPEPGLRALFDKLVLLQVKTGSPASSQQLARLCAGLSAGAEAPRARSFWHVAAAFFEAIHQQRLPSDVYVKRAASRILLQFAGVAKGQAEISETLLRDLLFFCAQASMEPSTPAPLLTSVRETFGLAHMRPLNYAVATLGRFDPSVLAQARKRIGSAKESWSLFTGGDVNRVRQVMDQFGLIADSLIKLHPASTALAQSLVKAVEQATRERSGVVRPELAMEVATTTLYLEAAFEDFDPNDPGFIQRTQALAKRLDGVVQGAQGEPLDPWMEQLYRRVSDRQTMGSVVGELKVSMGEAEKSLDQFFRMPREKACLHVAAAQLSQMRGVLSVLGLDQAVQTVNRMRQTVDEILDTEVDEAMAREAGTFQTLGNNLSALSFLVDMLNYQPALAKKLFVFDEESGELRPLMGRTAHIMPPTLTEEAREISAGVEQVVSDAQGPVDLANLSEQLGSLADKAALAEQTGVAKAARDAAEAVVNNDAQAGAQALVGLSQTTASPSEDAAPPEVQDDSDDEDDLLDIFLEEAREVVATGLEAVNLLREDASDLEQLTTLRRAFHTLKGSSRMVGLTEFGEGAWALEQVFNGVLAEQKPAQGDLLTLAQESLSAFGRWADDIGQHAAGHWRAKPFVLSAEAWREFGVLRPLALAEPLAEASGAADAVAHEQALVPEGNESDGLDADEAVDAADDGVPADVDVDAEASVVEASEEGADTTADDAGESADEWASEVSPETGPEITVDAEAADVESVEAEDVTADAFVEDGEAAPAAAGDEAWERDYAETTPSPLSSDESSERAFAEHSDASESLLDDLDFSAPSVEGEVTEASPEQPADDDRAQPPADAVDPLNVAAPDALPSMFDGISLDLEDLPPLGADAPAGSAPAEDAVPADTETTELPELPEAPVVDMGLPLVEAAAAASEDVPDDQTRQIGPLRIGIKLYNVYLNEADEWSRRLVNLLGEWQLEHLEPLPEQAEGLAHSLAGSSATVGFEPLSGIARALEHALGAVALHQREGIEATPTQAQLFVDAAEDIRRLLHQFAAGFYKDPQPELVEALDRLLHDLPAASGSELDIELLSQWAAEDAAADASAAVDRVGEAAPSAFAPPELDAPADIDVPTALAPLPEDVEPSGPVQDIDDDIDVLDTIDVDLFPIFAEEAQELLPKLGAALRQWSARPDNTSARSEVLRNLHTLKGSARLAGALRLGEMAHRMETAAERLGSDVRDASDVEPLVSAFDALVARFELLRRMDPQTQHLEPVAEADLPAHVVAVAPESAVVDAGLSATLPQSAVSTQPGVPGTGLTDLALPQAPKAAVLRAGAAVRVRPELLDRLVNQAGEVITTRSRMESEMVTVRGSLKELTGNLDRLRQQLRDLELQAETQMQSRLAQARDSDLSFDPLEFDRFTRVQELTRMMAESVNDVATVQRNLQRAVEVTEDGLVAQARQTRELQRDLLRTRMVEFEGISERLYRVVRQASKETGKQVRLDISGGHIEMDRGVLDRMTAAFEHLLRNSVVHGIEAPEDRVAAGKPAEGAIDIRLTQELNDVSVVFQDDGAGLNLNRLREKAKAQGLVPQEAELSDAEAAQLVFAEGLSTAAEVTSLAGRGVGMDVVRNDVVALGGRVETATQAGQGTEFKLVLPLTTAVTQVVMVRAGGLTLGVPSTLVEVVRRLSGDELAQAYAKNSLTVAGEEVPFYWAGALLQLSAHTSEPQGRTLPVVIFRSAAQRVAMHVDEVLGNQEVVVKNLGPQLSRLPGLAGMSVLASGAVALIYNPVALATVYGARVQEWRREQAEATTSGGSTAGSPAHPVAETLPSAVPMVLVVDDSITVRRVTQRLLQREGYRVTLAADGLQALERLQQELPTVVLSDIEMPRMDGFDLVRNLRADPRLASLPVIMITSRIAEKHREHARELGVDHYLGKPYSEDELLALIGRYAQQAAEAGV